MYIEDGQEPPDTCVPPPVNPALTQYVEAFNLLTWDRPVGFGAGPIPTGAIITYARHAEGVTRRRDLKRFLRMVRAIDHEYLTAQQSENADGDGHERHRRQDRH